MVNVGVRDSTYVLDALPYHDESDLRIEENYTDTAGFTDHVFGLMHLLGFRFAPRIRDFGETKLFVPKGDSSYDVAQQHEGRRWQIQGHYSRWTGLNVLCDPFSKGP